jgi:hypothetical protein
MSREEYVDNMLKVCTNYFHNFFFTFSWTEY